EVAVVLDDAVVDERDFPVAGEVRVGVELVDAPVGGPAGVADAEPAGDRMFEEPLLQDLELARTLLEEEFLPVEDDDARGVVAAVLEAAQAVDDDGQGVAFADVTNDAAHNGREKTIAGVSAESSPESRVERRESGARSRRSKVACRVADL